MKTTHSVPWILLFMPQIFASHIVYLKGIERESVLFDCESEETSMQPIGLYLNRKCVGPAKEVLFFSAAGMKALYPEDEERIQVLGKLSTNHMNVTISQLQRKDSGLYYCLFVYEGEVTDINITGKTNFLLFVDTMTVSDGATVSEGQYSCSSYPPLLYAISAAVGLLLLILLGLGASHWGKPCKRSKPQSPVPIYEEMIGIQPANRKAPPCHLDSFHQEEADSSVYINPQVKPQQENHYVPEGSVTAMEDNQ
ncbi:hypothetical protein COCON_G00025510 [Conger conger]|uniref:Ig-like domain-containing protein n=1 Tax=Conger conger TaxID=82655 RepID=A0A9Q1DXS0_CONCO|nr:hypothetical protein COCON_G00025510 [Conger conger]